MKSKIKEVDITISEEEGLTIINQIEWFVDKAKKQKIEIINTPLHDLYLELRNNFINNKDLNF